MCVQSCTNIHNINVIASAYIHTVEDAGFIQGGGGCQSAHMKNLEAMSVFD